MTAAPTATAHALELEDLEVAYRVRGQWRQVLRGVNLHIAEGESYGLVGESGCGKSTAAFAALRYLPRNGRVSSGSIRVAGEDLLAMSEADVRRLRATKVSMVYQNPTAALNPSIRIGDQLTEVYALQGVSESEAPDRALEILRKVQISDPTGVMRRYPHQLSGGMNQRVVIAMALAKDPTLLILDEPTTGLDATVEAEVLDLVSALSSEFNSSVLFISHSLDVIARMCDRMGVLYAGRVVEQGTVDEVFNNPRHPYTVGLLRCIPRGGARKDKGRLDTIPGFLPGLGAQLPGCVFADRCGLVQDICREKEPDLFDVGGEHSSRCHFHEKAQSLPRHEEAAPVKSENGDGTPILQTRNVRKTFQQEGHDVRAVEDLTFELAEGETLGLVGESGSGKTTLARLLLGLTEPDEGSVVQLDGENLAGKIGKRDRDQVRAVQIVFQNPDAALNRRFSIHRIISRALTMLTGTKGSDNESQLRELAHSVRFDVRLIRQRPSQLSGGLKQRVAIARAFAGDPRIVVCDEPTSALDVSVQAAILNLLAELQAEKGTAYLFISHDLGVVRYLSDRIAVLYLGRLMELGVAETVYGAPQHPYTEALLSAVPTEEGTERPRIRLEGEIPSHADPPSGCVFHTRCPRYIGDVCREKEPELKEVEPGHFWRCHYSVEELRELQKTPPEQRVAGAPQAPAEAQAVTPEQPEGAS
jgi:peptide/nickel transport system ATP-binding protein